METLEERFLKKYWDKEHSCFYFMTDPIDMVKFFKSELEGIVGELEKEKIPDEKIENMHGYPLGLLVGKNTGLAYVIKCISKRMEEL